MARLPARNGKTKLDRVLEETSHLANEIAKRWGTTKVEVYRYLVELAVEGRFDSEVIENVKPKQEVTHV